MQRHKEQPTNLARLHVSFGAALQPLQSCCALSERRRSKIVAGWCCIFLFMRSSLYPHSLQATVDNHICVSRNQCCLLHFNRDKYSVPGWSRTFSRWSTFLSLNRSRPSKIPISCQNIGVSGCDYLIRKNRLQITAIPVCDEAVMVVDDLVICVLGAY